MAKVKNVSGQTLEVPALGRVVLKGQEVEVADEQVFGLTQQDIWEPVDDAGKAAHEAGEDARDERVKAEHEAWHGAPHTADEDEPAKPARKPRAKKAAASTTKPTAPPAAPDNTEED